MKLRLKRAVTKLLLPFAFAAGLRSAHPDVSLLRQKPVIERQLVTKPKTNLGKRVSIISEAKRPERKIVKIEQIRQGKEQLNFFLPTNKPVPRVQEKKPSRQKLISQRVNQPVQKFRGNR